LSRCSTCPSQLAHARGAAFRPAFGHAHIGVDVEHGDAGPFDVGARPQGRVEGILRGPQRHDDGDLRLLASTAFTMLARSSAAASPSSLSVGATRTSSWSYDEVGRLASLDMTSRAREVMSRDASKNLGGVDGGSSAKCDDHSRLAPGAAERAASRLETCVVRIGSDVADEACGLPGRSHDPLDNRRKYLIRVGDETVGPAGDLAAELIQAAAAECDLDRIPVLPVTGHS